MASFLRKTMVYLGLVDEDYDEYEEYVDRNPRGLGTLARTDARGAGVEEPDERSVPDPVRRIRTLPREPVAPVQGPGAGAPPPAPQSTMTPRPITRPSGAEATAKVHVVAPQRFGDAKEIADYLKGNRPVIVNLQVAERELQRRMIDFCSGLTYALSGEMERVADEVFLLTPTNVKVSDEERQRLQERGLVRS